MDLLKYQAAVTCVRVRVVRVRVRVRVGVSGWRSCRNSGAGSHQISGCDNLGKVEVVRVGLG